MKRPIVFVTVGAVMLLGPVAVTVPAQAKVPGPNGQIAFSRVVDPRTGATAIFTVNPDGTKVQQLFSNPAGAGAPHWSPDGSQVSIFCCDDGMAAHIVDANTGAFRELAPTDSALEVHCGFWTSDGTRLACKSFGLTDASRTGVWTIRATDGGGLAQITSNPGGDDIPGEFSPDGKRLVFFREVPSGEQSIDVVRLNGSGLRQITPPGTILAPELSGLSWSPIGNKILFVSQLDPHHRHSIWVVDSDGSDLHQVPIPGCGGAFSDPRSIGCGDPGWSPDGTRIVFTRGGADGTHIYTVKADGSGLFQVTRGGLGDLEPDWGPRPLAT